MREPKYRTPIGLQIHCLLCCETESLGHSVWPPTSEFLVDVKCSHEGLFVDLSIGTCSAVERFHACDENVGHPGRGPEWFRDLAVQEAFLEFNVRK